MLKKTLVLLQLKHYIKHKETDFCYHFHLSFQVEEITLTLEPEPCSLSPSPLREDIPSFRDSSPGLPAQMVEPVAERISFDVTPCVVQLLEKDEEEEGSFVVVATT